MIITEAMPMDGVIPDHKSVDIEDAPLSEFARIGEVVGRQCREEFNRTYGGGSNADVRRFYPALGDAITSALLKMKAAGCSEEKVAAWRDAFWVAMNLTDAEWKLLSGML